MNSFWFDRHFSTVLDQPQKLFPVPVAARHQVLEFAKPSVELCSVVVVLFWPLDVFDIDRFELAVVVRARLPLRVLHDAQLVFQFFDSGHEILDHRELLLLKSLVAGMRSFSAIVTVAPLPSLSVNEQVCVFASEKHLSETCVRKSNSHVNVRTQLKNRTSRLPWGRSCYSVAATCGHHRWAWAFPHGSHKQRTYCLVSVFSHQPRVLKTHHSSMTAQVTHAAP